MRSASEKTIRGSRSTRMLYAKRAIDREAAMPFTDTLISIEASILKEYWPNIKPEDMLEWALKERDYRVAIKVHVDLVCTCGKKYTTTAVEVSKNRGVTCSQSCASKRPHKKRVLNNV